MLPFALAPIYMIPGNPISTLIVVFASLVTACSVFIIRRNPSLQWSKMIAFIAIPALVSALPILLIYAIGKNHEIASYLVSESLLFMSMSAMIVIWATDKRGSIKRTGQCSDT